MATSQISDSLNLSASQNRTTEITIALFNDDGTAAVINDGDEVHLFVANERTPGTVLLDLSGTATANGSVCAVATSNPLVLGIILGQDDMDFSGPYLVELVWIDGTQPANLQEKELQSGVLQISATIGT